MEIKEPTRKLPEIKELTKRHPNLLTKKLSRFETLCLTLVGLITIVLCCYYSTREVPNKPVGREERKVEKTRVVSEKERTAVELQRAERTPEHTLAIIHEGWEVPEDHTTVFRFRYLLQQLDVQCIQSKEVIADQTVWAQEYIRKKHGIKMNLLSMMEEMNKTMMVYRPEGGGDYAELLAAEMVLWMKATE